MKRKRSRTTTSSAIFKKQTVPSYYLPDDCWESIFRFIINDNDDDCNYNNHRYLNLLSLVSKEFLSITDRLRFSITINKQLKYCHVFMRFTNLNSLKLNGYGLKINKLLRKISRFPLKELTSLNISDQLTFPADGLRAFSKKIKTITSFTCSNMHSLNPSDLFLIVECFPMLEQLYLNYSGYEHRSSYLDEVEALSLFATSHLIDSLVSLKGLTCLVLHSLIISDELLYSIAREGLPLTTLDLHFCKDYSYAGIFGLLSKCQRIQHLNLEYANFLNDQHVVQLSSFLGDLVSKNLSHCHELTKSALFTLAKNCPSLSDIKMERIGNKVAWNSDSFEEFGVYPRLKSLYLGRNSWLIDQNIIMFASNFPNLQLLHLNNCYFISEEGICEVLRKCCKIKHLNLTYCSIVNLLGINFVVPNLEVLNLSDTNVNDETLYVISKNCCGLSQLLLRHCTGVTKKAVKHVLESCTKLREVVVRGLDLSDKNWKLVSGDKYIRL